MGRWDRRVLRWRQCWWDDRLLILLRHFRPVFGVK